MKYFKGNATDGLTPITSAWMHNLFKDGELLNQLIAQYGSPVNLHNLSSFEKNIEKYKNVFESRGLRHQIYYARKANKSRGLVKHALESGIGVDTASYKELLQSLELGGDSQSLVLTSAIKTTNQIELALQNKITIILDNSDECNLINSIAKKLGIKADVGIRVSGFYVNKQKLYSRFGFDIDEVIPFTIKHVGKDKELANLNLTGLHFHLDGYSTEQRALALSSCISLANQLKHNGYPITFIDMGGGILMNYLAHEQEWIDFDYKLRESVQNEDASITFNGTGLGYEMVDGKLNGKLNTYPFFNSIYGVDFLNEILDYRDSNNDMNNTDRLKSENIEIRIEPGRSLLNQTGITAAKVAHRKKDSKGQWLVGLEMNMSQMMSSSADFLLDPYIVYHNFPEDSDEVQVYFTGAYCLERDVLLKRKITLPKLPERGDIVMFINTAGYMMHFFETEAHLFELSKNIMFKENSPNLNDLDFIEDSLITK
ncbi:alanine racemase [Arenibacter certesii]|uniref:Diaminopimelate decarboxylase n=1 Tax=Arenibacter certesii TaxID=228955 RepID=A0A918J4U1_9FLAO|nr:alanine racemase [Arenibacter certesii]GGW45382.1 diaminopimelate decarboxylase [Arenibacter certesii]